LGECHLKLVPEPHRRSTVVTAFIEHLVHTTRRWLQYEADELLPLGEPLQLRTSRCLRKAISS
jgi:hypothetical protein